MNETTPVTPATPTPPPPTRVDGSGAMFDRIAARYDLLNRVMSLGLDAWWRRRLVRALALTGPGHVLDVATGTADVALAIRRAHPEVRVTGLDPSVAMLARGAAKLRAQGVADAITLVTGDAQQMPFAPASFDGACISFGIRNVPDRMAGLREMVRVCRPGARVVVLELGEPRDGIFGPLTRLYVHTLVPLLGSVLSGAGAEYRYLQRSIAAFPAPGSFVRSMENAGLARVEHRRLSFGAVHLFWGQVPPAMGAA